MAGKQPHLRRARLSPLDDHPFTQCLQLLFGHATLHLYPVVAPVAETWIGQALLESALVGEQQQAFAVGIQSSRGVDPGNVDQISQAAPTAPRFRRELTEVAVGLVKQQGCQPAFSRVLHRLTTPIEISSSPRSMVRGGRITDCIVSWRGA